MAVASLILGIFGLVLSFVFGVGLVPALVGMILGIFARKKAVLEGTPTGMATAGLVLGIIGFVIGAAVFTACAACSKKAYDDFQLQQRDPAARERARKQLDDFDRTLREAAEKSDDPVRKPAPREPDEPPARGAKAPPAPPETAPPAR